MRDEDYLYRQIMAMGSSAAEHRGRMGRGDTIEKVSYPRQWKLAAWKQGIPLEVYVENRLRGLKWDARRGGWVEMKPSEAQKQRAAIIYGNAPTKRQASLKGRRTAHDGPKPVDPDPTPIVDPEPVQALETASANRRAQEAIMEAAAEVLGPPELLKARR